MSRGRPFTRAVTHRSGLRAHRRRDAAPPPAPTPASAAVSAQFFELVRSHTWQGTFGDPYYGGNANFVGWDLLGYPGVRTYVSPEEQRLNVTDKPNHKSAYDNAMFNKATARRGPAREIDVDGD